MRLDSITLENWRCFSDEIALTFDDIEIFCLKNGSGKSSVFMGMLYGLYGKAEKSLATYQNHDGDTKVKIDFTHNGDSYSIERKYPNTTAVLYQNGKEIRNGSKEVYAFMDALVPYKMVKRLWFSGDVSGSDVLDINFFQNEILTEILKDPNTVELSLRKESNSLKRRLRDIVVAETRTPEEVKKDIDELTEQLKGRSDSSSDSDYENALKAKKAEDHYQEVLERVGTDFEPIDRPTIERWESIDLYQCQMDLKAEKEKMVDSLLSNVNKQSLKKIVKRSKSDGRCAVCGGDWNEEREAEIKRMVSEGVQDSSKVKALEDAIEFKRSHTEKEVSDSKALRKARCKRPDYDYQAVIDAYDKQSTDMWDRLDALNAEHSAAIKNDERIKESKRLQAKSDDITAKHEVVKGYLKRATQYHTDNVLTIASELLNKFNRRYSNIKIDEKTNALCVDVDARTLFASQLSGGEQTLFALSLVLAIRDTYTPGMPLVFDESFATLDAENNGKVISYFMQEDDQLFVISHNPEWMEHASLDKSKMTIRQDWNN